MSSVNLMGSAIFADVGVFVARGRRLGIVEAGQNEKEKGRDEKESVSCLRM